MSTTSVDPPTSETSSSRRSVRQALQDVANPATVKGAIAVVAGVTIIALPGLSQTLVELTLGAALVAAGLYDLWFGLTGRGDQRSSRILALLRGLAAVGVGVLLLLASQETLAVIVFILGFYLVFRGLTSLVTGLVGRDRSQRTARLTIGFGSLALGVLAITSPASVSDGIIVSGAVISIIVGMILLSYGLRAGAPTSGRPQIVQSATSEILWDWVRTEDVGTRRRDELADSLYFENPGRMQKLAAWWVMLLLSVSIATFAVLQDSTAVVIGAMLIAPLMTPILGLSGALVNGWTHRAAASSALVAAGVAASIALAFVISAWVPDLVSFDANTQISSRVQPTFVDMLIALAAGAAGAFATVNVRVASSIAGVAIAVALVPPLGVVGVALQNLRFDDALGAFILFLTNFVSIVLAAAGVFVLTGFAESTNLRARSRQILSTLAPFGALALVVLVPLVFTAEGILASATQQRTAQAAVTDWIGEDSRLLLQQVTVDGDTVTVLLTGSQTLPSASALHDDLTDALGTSIELIVRYTPGVQVTVDQNGEVEGERPDVLPG